MVTPPGAGAQPGSAPGALPGPPAGPPGAPGAPAPNPYASGTHAPGPHAPGPYPPGPHAPAPRPTRAQTRWVWCLVGSLLAVASIVWIWAFFEVDARGRYADQLAFLGSERGREQIAGISRLILGVVSPWFLVAAVTLAVAVALIRRRWGDAVRAAGIVAGANLTTQILKGLLERPVDDGLLGWASDNSLPSGHTTVAASVAAVALLVVPRAARPVTAILGAAYAAATAVATLALGWHRPADVVAAFAVVSAWTLLVLVPSSGRAADGEPGTAGRILAAWLLGLTAVVGIGVGLAVLVILLAGVDASAIPQVNGTITTASTTAYVGASFGVVGSAALASWALLLARR